MDIRLVQDLKEAERVWKELSPGYYLEDLWDFRFAYYQVNPWPLYFYVAYENGEPVGLLPLQKNTEWKGFEFFAEDIASDNRPFVKPGYEHLIPELFQAAPQPCKIYDIAGDDPFITKLPIEDYIYYLDTAGIHSYQDYLQSRFSTSKKRNNFDRLFRILERDHEVKVVYDNFADMERLMDLNVSHFGEESYLRTEKERQPYLNLLKAPLDWRFITVEVDGEKLACSLAAIYNGVYYYLIVGSDISQVPDAFKYLTKANLELALKEGVREFNCALGACNWKEYWHLDKRPQYEFTKE